MPIKRMAGQRIPPMYQDLTSKLYLPYGQQARTDGNAGYTGRTQQQWIDENKLIQRELEDEGSFHNMRDHLVEDLGWDEVEAKSTASDAANDLQKRGRVGQLRVERYGVPNASADEAVSRAVLEASGFRNVAPGSHMGTDIVASQGDRDLLIDAQTRLGRDGSYSMGVLAGADMDTRALVNSFTAPENQGKKLKKLIKELRVDNPRLRGDKLLHEPGVYEQLFDSELDPGKYKDAIISTNRSNYNQRRDNPLGTFAHGPYNPVRPAGVDLIDLEATRNLLLNEEIGTLRNQLGIYPAERSLDKDGGALRLLLNQELMQKLGGKLGGLDPAVVRAFSAR